MGMTTNREVVEKIEKSFGYVLNPTFKATLIKALDDNARSLEVYTETQFKDETVKTPLGFVMLHDLIATSGRAEARK